MELALRWNLPCIDSIPPLTSSGGGFEGFRTAAFGAKDNFAALG
jgi:hypothetical protein